MSGFFGFLLPARETAARWSVTKEAYKGTPEAVMFAKKTVAERRTRARRMNDAYSHDCLQASRAKGGYH